MNIDIPFDLPADLAARDRETLASMHEAAAVVLDCHRVLAKVDLNIVGECLKGQGTFYEEDHYPEGDVYDEETFSQYYYHAHRGTAGEHGHFHTFLRARGMPEGLTPVPHDGEEIWPSGDDALAHLVAISMDKFGIPIGLFATNRWVTGETWYAAGDVIRLLDRFEIDHAYPSWPINVWLTAMMKLFRPQIEALLLHRDIAVARWAAEHPGPDVFEDRDLEITGSLAISVDEQVAQVEAVWQDFAS